MGGRRYVMFKMVRMMIALAVLSTSAWAYEETSVSGGGAVSGVVKLDGKVPHATLKVSKDQEVCGKEKPSPAVSISSGGAVANVIVSLTNITKGKKLSTLAPKPMDQKGCDYDPHIVLLPKGTALDILNSDGILHNVHSYANKNPGFNKAMPKFKKQLTIEGANFSTPERIEVRCDAHEWMGGWIQVVDHPYYAVTDKDGKFTLADVPPGKYTVEAWHEKLGMQTAEVTVSSGGTATANFTFKK